MKKVIIWLVLFQKRLLKKPMFQITIVLIPVLLIILASFSNKNSSLATVALFTEENEGSTVNLIEQLEDSSDGIISFYSCNSEKKLRTDIMKGKAQCGYIIPGDVHEKINNYYMGNVTDVDGGKVKSICKNSSVTTKVIDELMCSKLFSYGSYSIVEDFVMEKQPDKLDEAASENLREDFKSRHIKQNMFTFEYIDGTENKILNSSGENVYMMPVRGILAVLILVASISGVLMLYKDDKNGVWFWIKLSKRPIFNYFYSCASVLMIGVCSLIAICTTGLAVDFVWELLLMVVYVFFVGGFCNFIRIVSRNEYICCSLIPILVLLCLVFCPVFVDLGSLFAPIKAVRLILPVNYYLESVYSSVTLLKMICATVMVSVLSILIESVLYRVRLLNSNVK